MLKEQEGVFVVSSELAAAIITDIQEILYFNRRRNALDPRKPVTPAMIKKIRKIMRIAGLAPRKLMVYRRDVTCGVEIDTEEGVT